MTYDCSKVAAKVYQYLDREELTWWQRARIRWHLKACVRCTDGFGFELRLRSRVSKGCAEDMPKELEQRLLTFIREHVDDESA